MNVVIIGFNGFIGSHLTSYFNSIGANILCVGRQIHDSLIPSKLSFEQFLALESKIDFDIWINAAGNSNVQLSILHPEADYIANVDLVKSLLNLKRKIAPTGVFVHFSSAAVYGNPEILPICEMSDLSPITPYGKHKLLSEELCENVSLEFGLKTLVFRPFSIYGIGQRKLLLWDIFYKFKQGENPIVLFGNGKESRDYLNIKDLTKLVEFGINQSILNNQLFDIYNVASGIESTVDSITKIVKSILPEIEFNFSGETRNGDPRNWKADISKAKHLGFNPRIALVEGIIEYYSWLIDEN